MVDLAAPGEKSVPRNGTRIAGLQRFLDRVWPDAAVIASFFAATCLFYWRIITPDAANRASFPSGDFIEQFYSFAFFRAQELFAGRIPLWQPYAYGGHPFVADIQSAVFYPLGWVTTLIAGARYPVIAVEFEAVFHIFLAAVFTYAFGMVRLRNRFAAAVAGLVFAFGGYLTSYPPLQLSILEVEVWLPLILLFAHLATRPGIPFRSRLASTVAGGLFLGVSALAGHPQAYMYVIYGTVAYLVFRLAEVYFDQGRRTALSAVWVLPVMLVVGISLAAVQFLPTYELMRVSSRVKLTYDFTSWGFPLKDILQIVLPGSVSLWSPMYIGILPLVLAWMAVQFRPSRQVLFWAFLAGSAFFLAFGGHTFTYSLFYLLAPGFSTFRDQERSIYLTSFAAAQLAGYGALLLTDRQFDPARIAKAARVLLLSAVGAFALLAVVIMVQPFYDKISGEVSMISFLFLMLIVGFLLLRARGRGLPVGLFSLAVLALIAFDLFSVNWKTNIEEKKPEEHYVSTPLIRYLQENTRRGRVFNEFQVPLNYGLVYGIEDINGSSPLEVERYKVLSELPEERWWQILNVRYLLTWRGGFPGSKKVMSDDKMNLYELPDPLPRASVVHDATVEPNDEKALAMLGADGFDLHKTVILAENPGLKLPGPGARPSEATFVEKSPDRLLIETQIDSPGILVVSEVFYPGWVVKVDGKPASILRADVALRGVPLEPGKHVIEMNFEPVSVKFGAGVTVLTLLASLVLLGGVKLWPRKQLS
ncbi:MAG: YfhO family protein [Dehalococcoidia bacterium]|nr:YfhO family protein [Dehalococcoidia bacterium]